MARTFQVAKTGFRVGPTFRHEKESISAHLTILFCGLPTARDLTAVTGYSVRRIIRVPFPPRSRH